MRKSRTVRRVALALLTITVILGLGLRATLDVRDYVQNLPVLGAAQNVTAPAIQPQAEQPSNNITSTSIPATEPHATATTAAAQPSQFEEATIPITKPAGGDHTVTIAQPATEPNSTETTTAITEPITAELPTATAKTPSKPPAITTTQAAKVAGEKISWAQAEILRLCNIEREAKGIHPLRNGMHNLQKAADTRAEESFQAWAHVRPDRRNWYSVLRDNFVLFVNAGENLAKGYENPKALIQAWMDSPDHKENILNPKFDYLSVGFCRGEDGVAYWSQMFVGL
jgi:uncharacterized protein YkwD